MPKKSANARGGVQRKKPKVQKSFELIHSERDVSEKPESSNVATSLLVTTREKETTSQKRVTPLELTKQAENENPLAKGSAAARMAARRHAAQKVQQRSVTSLITAEHFAYVRRDLITIAILAIIMFTAIITLYVTIGRA